jgi:uroporphyrinogen decarboxylase
MPADVEPLRTNIRRIVGGEVDMALFCSGQQVVHLLEQARAIGLDNELRTSMSKLLIGSIGPVTTDVLEGCGLHVDFQPEHPRLGHLVLEAVKVARGLHPDH